MEYGLIYYQGTSNLGDDIQTYSAMQFLPRVDYLIERENLDGFFTDSGYPAAVIFAGWFLHNHLNWPPSPYILPYITSFHLDTFHSRVLGESSLRNFVIDGHGAQWLTKHGPVGCRDESTKYWLLNRGVPCFSSGCLTTTIPKFSNIDKHDNICAVDVPLPGLERIKKDTRVPVIELSHIIELAAFDFKSRMKLVEERLRIYQGASLVVTTRLHAAIPCLVLGTPVLFLREEIARDRVDSYLQYLNWLELSEFIAGNNAFDLNKPPDNPETHNQMKEMLHTACTAFIARCERIDKPLPKYNNEQHLESVKNMNRLKELMTLRVNKYQK